VKHKAISPEETVHNARNILYNCNVFTIENWVHNQSLPPSVRINIHDLPVGTNGKGMDYKYALASGYGEFLERFQNLILFNDSKFTGNHDWAMPRPFDSKELNLDYFVNNHPEILFSLVDQSELTKLERSSRIDKVPVDSLPFLHFNSGEH